MMKQNKKGKRKMKKIDKNDKESVKEFAEKRDKMYCLTAKYFHFLGKLHRKEQINNQVKKNMATWKKELDNLQTEYNFR